MERKTGTPLIDGGIVNAPPNTTATYDFAENPSPRQTNAGTTSSGVGNARAPTTGQEQHMGGANAAGSDRAGIGSQ